MSTVISLVFVPDCALSCSDSSDFNVFRKHFWKIRKFRKNTRCLKVPVNSIQFRACLSVRGLHGTPFDLESYFLDRVILGTWKWKFVFTLLFAFFDFFLYINYYFFKLPVTVFHLGVFLGWEDHSSFENRDVWFVTVKRINFRVFLSIKI